MLSMCSLFRAELMKLRRSSILLVGLVALALCPVVQYGSQLIVAPEYRDANYDFAHLFENVVWGNSQIFLPISLVMIGAWLIDRESADDTLKNILAVPVAMPKLLGAKLCLMGLMALFFGLYSAAASLITGLIAGLDGLTAALFIKSAAQITAAALTTYIVCMPLILIFGQMRGAYLGGSILAFFMGYSILFFKNGALASVYPFSAALIAVGFDMSDYVGKTAARSMLLALFGLGLILLLSALLLVRSGREREIKSPRRKSGKGAGNRKRVRKDALK